VKKHLEVTAAILVRGGKILCAKRGAYKYNYVANKFEFPGGKLEAGETKTAALERELREEMDLQIQVRDSDLYTTINYEYPDFTLTMYCFLCHLAGQKFVMKEHVAFDWLAPRDLNSVTWAPADAPIIARLAAEPENFFA
jgi:8-oxo-dGTP diphosphatase